MAGFCCLYLMVVFSVQPDRQLMCVAIQILQSHIGQHQSDHYPGLAQAL